MEEKKQEKAVFSVWLFLCYFFLSQVAYAQDSLRYIPANDLVLLGKPKPTKEIFQRIQSRESNLMPQAVQDLALNSAGIAVVFETNSSILAAKWTLAEDKYFANMTPIAHSGLDLYCLKDGKWQYVGVGKPAKDMLNQKQIIISRMDTTTKQFMLYLPLYNTVSELQIGIEPKSSIGRPKQPGIDTTKRVVIYGSSIVQGASASRPAMAYPAIIQRKLGIDVINLGFSGSAKMEMALAKYLATVSADCYILDCIPNQTVAQINERALPFIKYLKSQHPKTPIILIESVIRETGYFDQQTGRHVKKQNESIHRVYQLLKEEKYNNIFYIPAAHLTGNDHEAMIDGTHLTDLGFTRMAEVVNRVLEQAIKKQ
ncbi:SGNH/GDSL hydrolase family protein [Olivibacter sp. CPCC 100613]|uniref:SGNH/GDSL hydrolase family protein n=1 Tax=Olivibacter sp. CPCC 100613 TaxID=3079931 RepID=UPI002FF4CEC1